MKKRTSIALLAAIIGCTSLSWGFGDGQTSQDPETSETWNDGSEIPLKLDSITQVKGGATTIKCSSGDSGCIYNTGTGHLYPGTGPGLKDSPKP